MAELNPFGGGAFGDQPFGPGPEESDSPFGVFGTPPACRISDVPALARSITPSALESLTPFAIGRTVTVVC